jgi:hypothetical protein
LWSLAIIVFFIEIHKHNQISSYWVQSKIQSMGAIK